MGTDKGPASWLVSSQLGRSLPLSPSLALSDNGGNKSSFCLQLRRKTLAQHLGHWKHSSHSYYSLPATLLSCQGTPQEVAAGPWLLVAHWRKGRHIRSPQPQPGLWNCWEQARPHGRGRMNGVLAGVGGPPIQHLSGTLALCASPLLSSLVNHSVRCA